MYSTTYRAWTMQGHEGASGLQTQDYEWMTENLEPSAELTEKDWAEFVDTHIENAKDSAELKICEQYEDREGKEQIAERIKEMREDLESERKEIVAYLVEWNRQLTA